MPGQRRALLRREVLDPRRSPAQAPVGPGRGRSEARLCCDQEWPTHSACFAIAPAEVRAPGAGSHHALRIDRAGVLRRLACVAAPRANAVVGSAEIAFAAGLVRFAIAGAARTTRGRVGLVTNADEASPALGVVVATRSANPGFAGRPVVELVAVAAGKGRARWLGGGACTSPTISAASLVATRNGAVRARKNGLDRSRPRRGGLTALPARVTASHRDGPVPVAFRTAHEARQRVELAIRARLLRFRSSRDADHATDGLATDAGGARLEGGAALVTRAAARQRAARASPSLAGP